MHSATQAVDVDSQARQISALPSDLLMVAESQWLFTKTELLLTPSIIDGNLSPDKERGNRSKGVNFILQAGIMLKLPQITLATASVFLHRFYMRHSMLEVPGRMPGYHYYSMAATCLFLATKVEENCRKMKELVIACVRVAQKDPNKLVDEQDKEYWKWRDNILHSEDVLLEALCFDLSLEAPYKTLFELLIQVNHEHHKELRNAAWAFVNDSCLTMLCLLFSSRTIAASALYAAARFTGAKFKDAPSEKPWWECAGVNIMEIRRACNYMADMYQDVPVKSGREGFVYERTPEHLDERDDQTRDLSPRGRQNQSQHDTSDATGRRSLKRDRAHVLDLDEQVNNSDASTHVVSKQPDGSSDVKIYKRVKLKDECNQQPESNTQQTGITYRPEDLLEAPRVDGAILAPEEYIGIINASKEEAQSGGGLVSPKLDEVSEEGEVEA